MDKKLSRAEKRRQLADARNIGKSPERVIAFGEEMFQRGYKAGTTKATESVMVVLTLVLHDKFGFGKTRLDRLIREHNVQTDCINDPDNPATIEALSEILWKELKIRWRCHK